MSNEYMILQNKLPGVVENERDALIALGDFLGESVSLVSEISFCVLLSVRAVDPPPLPG